MAKKQEVVKTTKQARAKGSEEARKAKKKYIDAKRRALKREEENYSQLLLVRDASGWWKMFGHSAVIFNYEIAKQVGYTARLKPDTDYGLKSEEGVVNIRDIEFFEEKLKLAKVFLLEARGMGRIYNLGKMYTKSDIEHMIKEKEQEWARVNSIILPKEIFPSLYALLRELSERVYHSTQKMEGYARGVIAEPILEKSASMLRQYVLCANDKGLSNTGLLETTKNDANWIIAQMGIVAELRLLDIEKIYRITRIAAKIIREVEQCKPKKV